MKALSPTYKNLQHLADSEVWPHCAEGMGVDGDEVTQMLLDEGNIVWSPDGFFLILSKEQVSNTVYRVFREQRGL